MIETLFLDEPLGVLDTESVPAFVDVLRVIMSAGIVSSIFVIAHDDRVIEALPQRLMVSRTDTEGSKVTLLS
jgi:DNA repair exonuclease SbcCD ATPase subunit